MISLTSTQLDAWLAAFIFPLARILGLMATAPVFNNAGMPRRIRLLTGLAIGIVLAPVLPIPTIAAGSWIGLAIIIEQMLIGIVMGFTLRLVFAAVDLAGELIGFQMGLSFAVFYDPQNAAQTPVLSEFMGLLSTLLFLSMNGHLLTLTALAESFQLLPITPEPFPAAVFSSVVTGATVLFSAGLLLSLPLIAALLIANLAMGVLARVAPQLNLFAIGFPVTLMAGFVVLIIAMPYFGKALERLYDDGFSLLHTVVRAAAT